MTIADKQLSPTDVLERHKRYLFPAVSLYYPDDPVVVAYAKDQYLWDAGGKRYLDFFGGVLTVSVGHCNDEVTARTLEQLHKVQHTSTLYASEIMVRVAEKVAAIAPGRLEKCFFTSSGSEANEMAILAARMYTGNTEVIALRHAYAGRTLQAMSLTAHGPWRLGGVFDGAIKHVRSPYRYRAPLGLDEERLLDLCVQDLEETIATCTSGKIAAFMAEPVQGVGGYIVPPQDYFRRVLPIVREAGGVFICDEVQTGWGRTGTYMCGIEHFGAEPEIITFAKGMANGLPIGCTVATPEVAEAVTGLTFATFGGNPAVMAAALATIEYIERNNLAENAAVQGERLKGRLEAFQEKYDFIGDVRGMGLMRALEIVKPGAKEPDAPRTLALVGTAKEHGLLIGKGGLYGNAVRISPHLNASTEDIDEGCRLLGSALADIA
jgi:4-aminobutyrate aminotransferase-like enzyme